MAAVTAYADIIEKVLDAYTKIPYAHGHLTCDAIFDRPRNRFVLMTLGWDDDERVHHPLAQDAGQQQLLAEQILFRCGRKPRT